MALDGESPQLERVGNHSGGRLPPVLITFATALVLVALLKPWPATTTDPNPSSHPRRPLSSPTAGSSASAPADRTALSGFFRQCYPTANWRLTALQQDGSMTVRTVWPAAARFDASLPPDDTEPHVPGVNVEGIGFCAPGEERANRLAQEATVSLWRRDPGGRLVPVEGTRVIDANLAGEGEVYLAPPATLGPDGDWPAGDYFFEISPSRAGSGAGWLALQILAVPGSSPSPLPVRTLGLHATVYRPHN